MPADLYCKIYVDGVVSKDELEELLVLEVPLRRAGRTLVGDQLEVDVRNNEDHSPGRFAATWEDFVFSRYYLDVEPAEGEPSSSYIESVAALLSLLREKGLSAIAACDFEAQLPANNFEAAD